MTWFAPFHGLVELQQLPDPSWWIHPSSDLRWCSHGNINSSPNFCQCWLSLTIHISSYSPICFLVCFHKSISLFLGTCWNTLSWYFEKREAIDVKRNPWVDNTQQDTSAKVISRQDLRGLSTRSWKNWVNPKPACAFPGSAYFTKCWW